MGRDLRNVELGKGIRQRKDGRYEARAQINGQLINLYNYNLDELRKDFISAKEKLGYEEPVIIGLTLNEWFEEWFNTFKAPFIKETSANTMMNKYKKTFGKYIGNLALKQLTPLSVQKSINTMNNEKVSVSAVRETIGKMRDCMESAKNQKLIEINPFFDVKVPWHKKNRLIRFFTEEEQNDFLQAVKGSWYEEMYQAMLLTGIRIGEVGGLKWEDIDFKSKIIHIRRALMCQYENGKKIIKLTTPKTINSYRDIPFMGNLEKVLLKQKEKQKTLKEHLGNRWRGKDEFDNLVFTTNMGSPVTRYSAESQINKVVKEINKMREIQAAMTDGLYTEFERAYPHAFRHTFASICFDCGMDVKVVQGLMGHESYTTTMDIYTHITKVKLMSQTNKFKTVV